MWPFPKLPPQPDIPPPISMHTTPILSIDRYLEAEEEELRAKCDVSLTIPKADVFSVERERIGRLDERTLVGHWRGEGDKRVVHQWYLVCSRAQHNAICKQYSNQ